ncbi:MerR family DNA-binding transcriptional regulator, partial [Candidatus Amesbacteria bacterium]|nr:MerR family DNA-binding transcriptional regulator [Candidatus Amesbacteria bacterium]
MSDKQLLTIHEAAQILGVSTKTLRRWEKQKLISPDRTPGNQRRYRREQLAVISRHRTISKRLIPVDIRQLFKLSPTQKFALSSISALTAISAILLLFNQLGFSLKLPQILRPAPPPAPVSLPTGAVLATESSAGDLILKVNVPTLIDSTATVSGHLTAPNIVYRLLPGTNIDLTGNPQTPTISATDQTADLKIFGSFKVGSTDISAGSKSDTLTLAGSGGVSISANTTDKKITISASSADLNVSGWTDSGTLIKLQTTTDAVVVGGSSELAKFAVDGDTDEIQLLVQGNSTQTANLLVLEQSDGTDVLTVGNTGLTTTTGDIRITGGTSTLEVGGLTGVAYNTFALSTDAPEQSAISAANDLYIGGDLEVDGTIYGGISGDINPGFTQGSVVFINSSGALAQDNANFFWNDTSDLLGLGTASPVGKLHVSGAVTGKALAIFNETGDQALLTASASGAAKFTIANSGNITAAGTISGLTGISSSGTITLSGLTASRAVFTDASSNLAATGASSDLLASLSDETGTGVAVFGTSPAITTSLTTPSSTFALVNTTATTVNFAEAATTISIGAGSGTTTINNSATVTGDLGVNGGDITSSATSFNLLQSTVTTLNLGGAATTVSLGASTGTATINNANTVVSGDLAINGGDLTTSSTTFNLLNATATTINFGGAATTLSIGAATGTTTINNALSVSGAFTLGDNGDTGSINTSDWDISTTGDLTGVGGITADGAIAFSPASTSDITFTTDADSTFVVSGLSTSTGNGLCLDGSNNVIICSTGSGSSLWTLADSTIYPNLATYSTLIGSTTTADAVGRLTVSGAKTGKALVVFNETGNQNILEASAGGVPVLSLERDGDLVFEGATNNDFETILTVSDPTADRTVTIPNATGTICLDSDNCTGGSAGPWNESAGLVVLDTTTNNVVIGGSSNLGKLAVDGDTDEIQLLVQGNSTQTANLLTLENSSATDLAWFDESGNLRVGASAADTGLVNVTGAFTGKALAIFNETGDQNILAASASGTTVATLGRTGNLSLTNSGASHIDFNLSSTGDFTISDAGSAFATFTDAGVFTLDSLNLDGTTIGLTSDTDLLSLAANELTVNGSIVATADLAVNGGDITSSASTFNLLNATVTTLNIGGAATTLSIGASSGTTTLNNALAVSGNVNLNGTNLTFGNSTSDDITFTARVAQDSDLIPIGTTGTNDLGASSLPWDNLYINNIIIPSTATGQVGYWTKTAGVLSPAITNDVLAATTSATVAMTITQTGAFNALLVEDQASDTTPFVIDQSGSVGIG